MSALLAQVTFERADLHWQGLGSCHIPIACVKAAAAQWQYLSAENALIHHLMCLTATEPYMRIAKGENQPQNLSLINVVWCFLHIIQP